MQLLQDSHYIVQTVIANRGDSHKRDDIYIAKYILEIILGLTKGGDGKDRNKEVLL